MQIAARLLMTAAAAAATAATSAATAANDAAETAADAGAGFGALLAAALSPPTFAADTGTLPLSVADSGAAAGAQSGASEPDALVAEPSPAPDLALQAMLMASRATTAQPPAAEAPAHEPGARMIDADLPPAELSPAGPERFKARKEAPGADARQPNAAATALATETTAATKPEVPATPMSFTEVLRKHDREAELPAAVPAAMHHAAAVTELPAAQVVRHVSAPLSSARWEQALGEQLLWVAQKDLQTASLTLNPPELGPVRIELQLNDTQAVANFSSQQPEVRKAIEDALPALKTLFADAGLQLQQANVGSGDAGQSPAQRRQVDEGSGGTARPDDDAPASVVAATALARASNRLLDTFA